MKLLYPKSKNVQRKGDMLPMSNPQYPTSYSKQNRADTTHNPTATSDMRPSQVNRMGKADMIQTPTPNEMTKQNFPMIMEHEIGKILSKRNNEDYLRSLKMRNKGHG